MKEEDIRKRSVFNKYLELVKKDVKEFFDSKLFIEINCPACGSSNFNLEFEKLGFKYVSCNNCLTLFTNPRPSFEMIKDFYFESPSTNFWINEFFKPVANIRREKIFKPRAKDISKLFDSNKIVGDVGAGFGLFFEELRKLSPNNQYIVIEPSIEMAGICEDKGFEVKNKCVEDVNDMDNVFDILTLFELTEHLFDPLLFFKKICSLLKPGGLLYLTTLNGKGFDIMLLWEKSKSVAPPQHLNFFNPYSMNILLERSGFEIIETKTPGKLDWDIVEGMIRNENVKLDRFWNLLATEDNKSLKVELQHWISKNNLSSHMTVLARKKA